MDLSENTAQSEHLYTLTVQEVGRSEPDVFSIDQAEHDRFIECAKNLEWFDIIVESAFGDEMRSYNIEFLSSFRIKEEKE